MNLSALLTVSTQQLESISTTPRLDSELLLAEVLQVPRSYFYTYPDKVITKEQLEICQLLLQRRLLGEPIAYILGHQEFWSLNLKVTHDVLIPRPETELLVEIVLKKLPQDEVLKVVDLGTGSGAIALALASERSHWQIYAVDVSAKALEVAKENARKLQIKNVQFFCGNWCDALPEGKYAAIVANPPYIAFTDPCVDRFVRKFEPEKALFADNDGLDAIHVISDQAKNKLVTDGWLFMEHGFAQGEKVIKLLREKNYCEIVDYQDFSGHARLVQGKI